MARGVKDGQGNGFFLPEGEESLSLGSVKALEKKHATLLPPASSGAAFSEQWPTAFWCSECKLLIEDYSNLM